ncbi:MAG: hypothetical protein KKB21_03895 [Nanoarchaeota archaeon]|nr:hypothetical protein [Nanoarchaeota archaeon]MBU4086690.1 hypothetical protein [Nanoarchaeota archaeon]
MALIEAVKQMQAQGLSDQEISQKLQEQGANPKEVDDAIGQSKIKAAVFDNATYEQVGQNSIIGNNEMQPSITSQAPVQEQPQQQENYYTPEQYSQQEYYQPQPQGASPDTISEIAEQIVVEKTSELKKTANILLDFKTVIEARVSSIDSRLKKIESSIEKLQSSIIGKVGEYGQAIEDIKNEIYGMEESFSKVINPLVERARHSPSNPIQETPEQQDEEPRESKTRKKQKDGFENYLSR